MKRVIRASAIIGSLLLTGCAGGGTSDTAKRSITAKTSPMAIYADFCDTAPCVSGRAPAALYRRIRIPPAPRGTCPTSASRRLVIGGWLTATVFGSGPVYVAFLEPRPEIPVIRFLPPASAVAPDRTAVPVKWLASPAYRGPILIRGIDLGGHAAVYFTHGNDVFADMPLAPGDPANSYQRWRQWPEGIEVSRSGCYALQIDGLTFTSTVVFRAKIVRSESAL